MQCVCLSVCVCVCEVWGGCGCQGLDQGLVPAWIKSRWRPWQGRKPPVPTFSCSILHSCTPDGGMVSAIKTFPLFCVLFLFIIITRYGNWEHLCSSNYWKSGLEWPLALRPQSYLKFSGRWAKIERIYMHNSPLFLLHFLKCTLLSLLSRETADINEWADTIQITQKTYINIHTKHHWDSGCNIKILH